MVLLDQVTSADAGLFKITDILGFTVSYVHLRVKRKDEEGARKKWLKNSHLLKVIIHSKLRFRSFTSHTNVSGGSDVIF